MGSETDRIQRKRKFIIQKQPNYMRKKRDDKLNAT